MPNEKIQQYTELAARTTREITGSLERWTAFLDSAAKFYKYPFSEQLQIYAQRPDATACADYQTWNDRLGRYVRRGSKGIVLVDDDIEKPQLRYVFDISDTGGRRRPFLWEYRPEHEAAVSAALEQRYGVPLRTNIEEQLETIAVQLVDEYWTDHQRDVLDIVDGSFLEEYDDFNVGAAFRSAAVASVTYTLLARCGLEPREYLGHEDFEDVFDFNTEDLVYSLGAAVSTTSEEILRRVEVAVKNYERERRSEHERDHLQTERGLSDPEHRPAGADRDDAAGQVRTDAPDLSEGTPPDPMGADAPERDAVEPPSRDRPDSLRETGQDDPGAGGESRSDGGTESPRPVEMGGADEQLQGAGRGDDPGGADLQLTEDDSGQASLFPTETEQIESIAEAESANEAPSALTFSQEEIDHFLRIGSNSEYARMRIAEEYSKQKPMFEIVPFIRNMYHGGYGIQTADNMISAWYAEDGIHLVQGQAARYVGNAQVISWEDAAVRIGELLEEGQFATNVELIEAHGHELGDLSQLILHQYHDLTDEARDAGYLSMLRDITGSGYPIETQKLSELLREPETRVGFTEQFRQYAEAWQADRSILRFRFYDPMPLLARLEDLELPRHPYLPEMTELPEVRTFITDDEIDAMLASRGSGIEGGKGRIYEFFTGDHTAKEKADFLKKEYGIGGSSHAISGSPDSWQDHDAKGLRLRKQEAHTEITWSKVAKRIDALIAHDRYLTPEEMSAWIDREAERAIDAHEAEFGADGSRVFPDNEPLTPEKPHELTQEDIDAAIQSWNGDMDSKRRVQTYMVEHAREKDTAAWLRNEFGGELDTFPVQLPGVDYYTHLTWPKLQRRIAQLVQQDRFFTEQEQDNFEDIDVEYVREQISRQPEESPFVQQVMGDTERIAAEDANTVTQEQPELEAFVSPVFEETDVELPEGLWQDELTGRTGDTPPYKVGDTVYLEDTAYEISAIRDYDVELLDPTLLYPIFRAENKSRFEIMLYQDPRNSYITDYLSQDLNNSDPDLQDVLVWDGGLLTASDKEQISEWFRAGESNSRIGQRLAETYSGRSDIMMMQTGDGADYTVTPTGIEISIEDKYLTHHTFTWLEITRVLRAMYEQERDGFYHEPALAASEPEPSEPPTYHTEVVEELPAEETGLAYDITIEALHIDEPTPEPPAPVAENYRITDDHLGEGGPKEKFWRNIQAIATLKQIEAENRQATPEEQHILSQYVGWGGLPDAFDPQKTTWAAEYSELKENLTDEEYAAARASTLNAHYTSPTVIRAVYEALGNMGFKSGNILEPSMGVGNFFGMLPEEMRNSRLYGVELDSISGRIAQQLYPNANITVAGFETTDRRDFYDVAVGNVPFGQYQVNDRAYKDVCCKG